MKLELIDEAKDLADQFDITSLAKEKDALVLTTPTVTLLIYPFDDLADAVVDLVGETNLPEPKNPKHTLDEDLNEVLMKHLPA